jgi:hypothetical protein
MVSEWSLGNDDATQDEMRSWINSLPDMLSDVADKKAARAIIETDDFWDLSEEFGKHSNPWLDKISTNLVTASFNFDSDWFPGMVAALVNCGVTHLPPVVLTTAILRLKGDLYAISDEDRWLFPIPPSDQIKMKACLLQKIDLLEATFTLAHNPADVPRAESPLVGSANSSSCEALPPSL